MHSRRVSCECCSSYLSDGGLSVGGFPVATILLRYAGAAVHVPGPLCPMPPSSRDVNEVGCVQQMLEAGASSLAPPRPARSSCWKVGPLLPAFSWPLLLFLVVSSSSCSEPFVDTGTGSPAAGPGLALSSASGKRQRLARELRVHALHYPLQTGLRFPLLCSDRWLLSFIF